MKIGILTYHLSHNYGAFLQAYSLCSYLRNMFPNETIEIIDYNTKRSIQHYKKVIISESFPKSFCFNVKRYLYFKKSKKLLPVSSKSLTTDNIDRFIDTYQNMYDVIIAGSDEIWRVPGFRGFPNAYWLPGETNSIKMSYAASIGDSFSPLSCEDIEKIRSYLSEFDYIGVRDYTSKMELASIIDKDIHINCDPVFLRQIKFDSQRGKELISKKFKIDPNKPTIGMMVDNRNQADCISSGLGNSYNIISLYRKWDGIPSCSTITPFEWADIIASLDFFIGSFFHGICISLINNVPFLALDKMDSHNKGKVYDLLSQIDLESRYSCQLTNCELLEDSINRDLKSQIDYSKELSTLCAQSESFISFLSELVAGVYMNEN